MLLVLYDQRIQLRMFAGITKIGQIALTQIHTETVRGISLLSGLAGPTPGFALGIFHTNTRPRVGATTG